LRHAKCAHEHDRRRIPTADVTLEPIKPLIGGRITVTKEALRDDAVIETLRNAPEERGVLIFPVSIWTTASSLRFSYIREDRARYFFLIWRL